MRVIAEIEWGALGETVFFSVIAGVGLTLAFSVAIFGLSRFADERRAGNGAEAVLAASLGLAAFAVCLAAIALGIIVMTSD